MIQSYQMTFKDLVNGTTVNFTVANKDQLETAIKIMYHIFNSGQDLEELKNK